MLFFSKKQFFISLFALCIFGFASPATSQSKNKVVELDPIVIGKTFSISSETYGQQRHFNIYLPPSYSENSKKYPVLYLVDGGVKQDLIHIAGIASLAADYRNIREFILVGIETADRINELTHPSQVALENEKGPTNGHSQKFLKLIKNEIIPFINDKYRTNQEAVLIGESLAGLFTVEVMLTEPDVFSGYIAVSPSLWWNAQSLAKESSELLKKNKLTNKKLYLTIADEGGDMREAVDMLAEAIKNNTSDSFDWTYQPMELRTHATIFHPAALEGISKIFALKPQVSELKTVH